MGPTSDMQDFLAPLRQLVEQLLDLSKCDQGKRAFFYVRHRWRLTGWFVTPVAAQMRNVAELCAEWLREGK